MHSITKPRSLAQQGDRLTSGKQKEANATIDHGFCAANVHRADSRQRDKYHGVDFPPPLLEGEELTIGQMQVFRLIPCGWSNSAIAAELKITDRTVEAHVKRILAKCGKSSVKELLVQMLWDERGRRLEAVPTAIAIVGEVA